MEAGLSKVENILSGLKKEILCYVTLLEQLIGNVNLRVNMRFMNIMSGSVTCLYWIKTCRKRLYSEISTVT